MWALFVLKEKSLRVLSAGSYSQDKNAFRKSIFYTLKQLQHYIVLNVIVMFKEVFWKVVFYPKPWQIPNPNKIDLAPKPRQ